MSFGPQSNMTRTQPASPGGMGGGNISWLMPLIQAMQQSRVRQMQQGGANRFMPQMQGGLFGNQPAPQMPRPQMPQQSMFTPVQQAPRMPFAPYAAPAPTALPTSLTNDQLMEWARHSPNSGFYDQHAAGGYNNSGGDGL